MIIIMTLGGKENQHQNTQDKSKGALSLQTQVHWSENLAISLKLSRLPTNPKSPIIEALNPKPSTSLTLTNNIYCPGSADASHIPYGQSGQRWGSQGPGPEPRSRWCPGRQCEAHPRRRPEPEEEDAGCWRSSLPGACGAAGGGS